MTPKIALFGINMTNDPDVLLHTATTAEALGYESVWTGEHIVLPDPQEPPSPAPPETPMLDTVASLSFLASATSTIGLGTGIIILPQRRPAELAKSLASLDLLSGGRLLFGLGVGYIPREFAACDTPMERRGERSDRYLEAMRELWSSDAVSIENEFVSFDRVTANPKPAQSDVHTVVGGHSRRATERAVGLAHGWYGFRRDLETTALDIARLREAADAIDRPDHLGRVEVSITPPSIPSSDEVAAYGEMGVDRLILLTPMHRSTEALTEFLEANAPST